MLGPFRVLSSAMTGHMLSMRNEGDADPSGGLRTWLTIQSDKERRIDTSALVTIINIPLSIYTYKIYFFQLKKKTSTTSI